jgi:hypothetical protein
MNHVYLVLHSSLNVQYCPFACFASLTHLAHVLLVTAYSFRCLCQLFSLKPELA